MWPISWSHIQLGVGIEFSIPIFNVIWDQIFSFNCSMGPKLGCHVKLGPKIHYVKQKLPSKNFTINQPIEVPFIVHNANWISSIYSFFNYIYWVIFITSRDLLDCTWGVYLPWNVDSAGRLLRNWIMEMGHRNFLRGEM